MGLFSTRNHDGASGTSESANTVSAAEMHRLSAVAKRHNREKQEVFSAEGLAYRRAHRADKAGTN